MAARTSTRISDLPPGLMIEILSRLSLRSLFVCRYVCRSWRCLYSDPLFVKLQVGRSPACILTPSRFIPSLFRFGHLEFGPMGGGSSFQLATMEFELGELLPENYHCVNSCNGLLCLESPSQNTLVVCNPILGEQISIELPPAEKPSIRLGFGSITCEYKVLIVEGDKTEIYTLGSKQWRKLENTATHPLPPHDFFNVSLHGSTHWIDEDNGLPLVRYFSFENEVFGSFDMPLESTTGVPKLGCLNGSLWVSLHLSTVLQVWVMKEYGIEESWTKMFAIEVFYTSSFQDYQLFHVLKDGIILREGEEIACYSTAQNRKSPDFRMEMFKDSVGIAKTPTPSSLEDYARRMQLETSWLFKNSWKICNIAYNPSFISLHDVARGEQLQMLRGIKIKCRVVDKISYNK